ncbi:hypothetical protein [Sinorhizobium sp. BJ1]|uniref:hypothetical protein n=1 Tax=Sinorhizobium sp. BJ1 TaxID=2035455 RepID=UPI000BE8981B|nr:hypothetical protein [Sinorhizobium sp. BJ1]PDT79938.1 hypothetical protein CO676_30255 [Sinorhizobium sp. BJ1]
MVEFAKNFVVGAVLFGALIGGIIGAIYGLFSFFYWLSGGELWGLPLFVVASLSLTAGASFAAHEAAKQ